MNSIEAAVLRTVLYADVFNFPLTLPEIHHFLIHPEPVKLAQIEQALATATLRQHLCVDERGYITRADRPQLVEKRLEREQASAHLWPLAQRYGRWLARLPYVRMVAVTGALAMRNAAHQDDDLDYLVVTAAHRVWLARALAIGLVRLVRLRGVVICPNYVLSENAFEQSKKDLFIAHEIAQMVPIYGLGVYAQFRSANRWVMHDLAQTSGAFYVEDDLQKTLGSGWNLVKRGLEAVLGGKAGDWLENWEYHRKLRRFAPDLQTEHSAAKLDEDQVKGHFNDYGYFVLSQYHARLEEFGLVDEVGLPATGD